MRAAYGFVAAAVSLVFWIMHNDYVATGFAVVVVIGALITALLIGHSDNPQTPGQVPTLTGCLPKLLQWFSVFLCFLMITGLGVGVVNLLRFDLIHAFLCWYGAVILFRIIHWIGALEERQNWPEMQPR